jgi:ATP-dependent Clp protease ATP-binding subunit ClpA
MLGKTKLAKEYCEKAIKYNPSYQYTYFTLAQIAEGEKDFKKAKEYYQKAISLDANYGNAYNNLGIIYFNEDNHDEAMKFYQKAIEVQPTLVYPYYNIGLIYERKADWKETRKWYKKALKVNPDYQYAKDGLAYVNKEIKPEDLVDEKDEDVSVEVSNSALEKFGRNLNKLAKEGKIHDPVSRENEIQSVLEILYKRIKNNPVLVGHPGVGKTAIVEGLAKRIVEKNVPALFLDKEIIELNVGGLIAGTTYRGQFEQKIKDIIQEVITRKNVIVFIDEIHTIIGAGRVEGGNMDLGQMLKPYLARGEFPCIGATTFDEYRKYIEKDSALERRFYPVRVDELSPEGTIQVLESLKPKLEAHYKLTIPSQGILKIVELTAQHIKKRYFPDKAIDIIEKVFSRCALKGKTAIEIKDILEIVGETCGISFVETNLDESSRLLNIEQYLKSQIMGQDDAIERVAGLIEMTKRRLDLKPERPDGVFLFTGPSGVGKTELAKQLAIYLYGDESKLVKVDMSEFSESHSVSKLIGSPPGYVGYDDVPFLTSRIEENPSSVLILDEIEKAHPDVVKLFLQVFDEGKIKDAKGKTIIFSDVIIIMTSNIVTEIKKGMGFQTEKDHNASIEEIVKQMTHFFPIEFLNRVDEIILFHGLSKDNIVDIVHKKIIKKAQKIFDPKGLKLEFTQKLIDIIIDNGYSKEFGARNLERSFEKSILRKLSHYLGLNKVEQGSTLKLDHDGNDVVISTVI